MTDEEIATALHEAAGRFNHFVHVAKYHGLAVWLDWIEPKDVAPGRVANLTVARLILPAQAQGAPSETL